MSLYLSGITNEAILSDERQRWRSLCLDLNIWKKVPTLLQQHNPLWNSVEFHSDNRDSIPEEKGIYMFVAEPPYSSLANLRHRYILYIGQSVNLRQRYLQYFNYQNSDEPSDQFKRIMILIWQECLCFNYFLTPDFSSNNLTAIEMDLIDMIVPPMNIRFRAKEVIQRVKFYSPR